MDDPSDLRYGGLKEGWDLNEDQMIPITEHGPHVNFLGVSYLIRDIVRYGRDVGYGIRDAGEG